MNASLHYCYFKQFLSSRPDEIIKIVFTYHLLSFFNCLNSYFCDKDTAIDDCVKNKDNSCGEINIWNL